MNWLPRLVARISATVHTKLLVAFLTIVMLLISLGVVGLQVLSSANRRAEHVLRRQELIAAYQQFQRETTLLPSWSWNERTLEARLRQLDQFRHELDQLQFAATDDAEQLASIRDSYDRSIKVIEQVVERFAAGDVAGGRALQLSQASPLGASSAPTLVEMVDSTWPSARSSTKTYPLPSPPGYLAPLSSGILL